MKIICDKEELFKSLSIVSKAVSTRTPHSTLDCILIDATGDDIYLSATDTEIGIEKFVDGNIQEKGIVAINSKEILEYVKYLPNDDILIETNERLNVSIRCLHNKAKYENIIGKTGEEFMSIPIMDREADIEISEYKLKEMINNTIFAVSNSENNIILTGELFETINNKLRVISMDGFRVSINMTELKKETGNKKVIIPSKTLSELRSILGGSMDEMVKIYIEANYVIFIVNNIKIYSTVIFGEYFNIDNMLVKDYSTFVTVNRKNLYDTLTRADVNLRETDKKPTILDIKDDYVNIYMNSNSVRFEEDIDAHKEGNDLKIGFRAKYILDALKAIDDEEIYIYLDGKISPMFIRDKEDKYIYVVLPINIMED